MIEALFFGVVVGVLAGLVPGIHTNLLAVIVASFQADAFFSAVFLVSVAVSRSITDALPTVFLGASDDVLSLLPGHQLLKKGKGIQAVLLLAAGSLFGCLASIAMLPIFYIIFPIALTLIKPVLFWFILAAVLVLLFQERKLWPVMIFILAGLLGIVALKSVANPLFPLLSGLFGASGLVLSIKSSAEIPFQQKNGSIESTTLWTTLLGTGTAAAMLLFPGLGPSQAAALVSGKKSAGRFLVLTGALGTADIVLSLAAFAVAGKARNGAVVTIQSLLGELSFSAAASLLSAGLAASGMATIATLLLVKWYARIFEHLDYALLCCGVLAFLLIMAFVLSGWRGILVLITATAIGLIAPLVGVRRSHAMGCLLIPTLIALW